MSQTADHANTLDTHVGRQRELLLREPLTEVMSLPGGQAIFHSERQIRKAEHERARKKIDRVWSVLVW